MSISSGRFKVYEMDVDGCGGEGYTVVSLQLYDHHGRETYSISSNAIENEEAFDVFKVNKEEEAK